MLAYKIIHEKEKCISCGACVAIAPEFWELDREGMAQLKEGKQVDGRWERKISTEEARAINQEAADCCPVQIIKLEKVKAAV